MTLATSTLAIPALEAALVLTVVKGREAMALPTEAVVRPRLRLLRLV